MQLLSVFLAGAFGGLINSLALWLFGKAGINHALSFPVAPALGAFWLANRMFWGGLWGIVFLLPFWRSRLYLKGLVLSILPTLVQLFVVFPSKGAGMAGLAVGPTAPLFVIFYNGVWGLAAAWWLARVMPLERPNRIA